MALNRFYFAFIFYRLQCLFMFCIVASDSLQEYDFPKGSLSCKLYNLSDLDCRSRDLTAIPPLPQNITTVNLAFNRIDNVSQTAFAEQVALTVLDIQSNILGSINGSPFEDLKELRVLHLTNSFLKSLGPTSFQGLHKLQQLFLRFNLLSSLPNEVFSDLGKLWLLDLQFNKLTDIPSQSVAPLHMLKRLQMFGNYFTSIHFGEGFRNLTHLSSLYFHTFKLFGYENQNSSGTSSGIQRKVGAILNNQTFENLGQAPLKRLDFVFDYHFNIPVTIADDIFSPLRCLEELVTPYGFENAISMITSDLHFLQQFVTPTDFHLTNDSLQFAFNLRGSLTHLDLSFSNIDGIYGPAFSQFSQLMILNLSCTIYSMQLISDDAFIGLYNLKELYLAYNQINKLPVNAFKSFANGSLKLLDLSFNALTGIFIDYDNAFASVASLTHLNLSCNPINEIGRWIHVLQNLEELKLDSITTTRFISFDAWRVPLISLTSLSITSPDIADIFKYQNMLLFSQKTPNLVSLSLAGAYVYSTIIISNLHHLKDLDASESFAELNEFDVLWGKFINFPSLQALTLASNKIKSIDKMRLNDTIPNIVHLDFRSNLIQTVLKASFEFLSKLRVLDLSGNQIYSVDGIMNLLVIETLHVSDNFITEIPSKFVQRLNITLRVLDISGNPFSCKCSIEPFRKWILSDTSVFLNPNHLYKCKTPTELAGTSVAEIHLDCQSHIVVLVTTVVASGIVLIVLTILALRYRWHIRYRLFLLLTRRRKYRPLQTDEGEDINMNRAHYDCFVSYAHESDRDLNWVLNDLRVNLEEGPEPLRLCIGHARDFIPGTPLLEAITEAIHNSRKTIVVLSPSYLESEWCYFETQHAWLRLLNEGQDVLTLVLLEPIPDDKMTMWLRQFLCKNGYLRWPHNKAAQDLFFRCLRELIKKTTYVDRRFDV